MLELGGHIKLNGFHDIDSSSMIIVKKMIGNYVKHLQEDMPSFQEVFLDLTDATKEKIQIRIQLVGSKTHEAAVSDVNLFFAVDKAFSTIIAEAKK